MKTINALFLVLVIVCLTGCKKENDTTSPTNTVNDNDGYIKVNSIISSKSDIGVFQKVTFSVDYTNTTKDQTINKEWFVDGKSIYNAEWTPQAKGEYLVKVKLFNSDNTVTFEKKVNVVDCDFYFGIWNDLKSQIEAFEDGINVSSLPFAYKYGGLIDNFRRVYKFDSNNKLIGGQRLMSMQFEVVDPVQYLFPLNYFNSELTKLTKLYGTPTYSEYNYDNISDKTNECIRIMNGTRGYIVKFESQRTMIECFLFKYLESDKYKKWGFTIQTTYTLK